MSLPLQTNLSVYLADDDADDRLLFEEALFEVTGNVTLTVAKNGEQLMGILQTKTPPPPQLIFLDLNMPLKNGFECLDEIRKNNNFKNIAVVIFSTSCQERTIDQVYNKGADFYLCKPDNFGELKRCIDRVFSIYTGAFPNRLSRKNFLISA
ncbi:MAG: response regulator [Ferruginibacter sp.]